MKTVLQKAIEQIGKLTESDPNVPNRQVWNLAVERCASILTALLPDEEKFAEEFYDRGMAWGASGDDTLSFHDYYSQFKTETNG